jgi:hypothetical protein
MPLKFDWWQRPRSAALTIITKLRAYPTRAHETVRMKTQTDATMLNATRASVNAMRRCSVGVRRAQAARFVGKQILCHQFMLVWYRSGRPPVAWVSRRIEALGSNATSRKTNCFLNRVVDAERRAT